MEMTYTSSHNTEIHFSRCSTIHLVNLTEERNGRGPLYWKETSKSLLEIPPLQVPFHRWRDLSRINFSEMASHNFCNSTVTGSKVQEFLCLPVWSDLEKFLELLRGKHKHGPTTQKPEQEDNTDQKVTSHELLGPLCLDWWTHPLMEVRDTIGVRTLETKEWYSCVNNQFDFSMLCLRKTLVPESRWLSTNSGRRDSPSRSGQHLYHWWGGEEEDGNIQVLENHTSFST